MNLRSQTAITNDPTWSATTQYFINDMVKSPATGGMYVYAAWDPALAGTNTSSCLVSANDPSTAGGLADGWAPCQGVGLLTSVQTTGTVAAPAAGAAGALVVAPALSYTVAGAGGLGVASRWHCKLDYTASIATGQAFAAEWAAWTFTPNGTAPVARQANHFFGTGATTSGSSINVVVNVPADATTIALSGAASAVAGATNALLFTATTVVCTWSRLK
jgi:hypothetical protein